jgi:hypothetical protein
VAVNRPRIRLDWWVSGGCILTAVALFTYAQVRGWTPGRVERTVNRDLPPGSTRAQIEADLDAKGWSHEYGAGADSLEFYGKYVGLGREQLGGVVFAQVPDPNVGIGGLDHGSITVLFFLDRDGRLIRSYARVSILSV